jgi:hypothetical protein
MFLKTSRYYKQKVVETETGENSTATGKKTVKAVSLRRLPQTEGSAVQVKGNDRLDIMAQRQYDEPGKFWYIADANSELEANYLVKEPGQIIDVPEQ